MVKWYILCYVHLSTIKKKKSRGGPYETCRSWKSGRVAVPKPCGGYMLGVTEARVATWWGRGMTGGDVRRHGGGMMPVATVRTGRGRETSEEASRRLQGGW